MITFEYASTSNVFEFVLYFPAISKNRQLQVTDDIHFDDQTN